MTSWLHHISLQTHRIRCSSIPMLHFTDDVLQRGSGAMTLSDGSMKQPGRTCLVTASDITCRTMETLFSWTHEIDDETCGAEGLPSLRRNALVMANQATGVFGDEAQPILELVRRHRPLTEVEAVLCPECGNAIRVWFNSEGTVFGLRCTAESGWAHYSRPERLASAPSWWRERIVDTEPITFYWPTMSKIAPDGTITMRATGYDEGSHWTGVRHFTRDTSDYQFWSWVVKHRSRWPQFFSDRDLPRLREEFTNAV
jgi:hypothetical protein